MSIKHIINFYSSYDELNCKACGKKHSLDKMYLEPVFIKMKLAGQMRMTLEYHQYCKKCFYEISKSVDELSCTGRVVDLTYKSGTTSDRNRLIIAIYCKRQLSGFMDTYKWEMWGDEATKYRDELKVGMRVKVKGFFYERESEYSGKMYSHHRAVTVEVLAGVENRKIDNVDETLGE